jgi:hypothetical protein
MRKDTLLNWLARLLLTTYLAINAFHYIVSTRGTNARDALQVRLGLGRSASERRGAGVGVASAGIYGDSYASGTVGIPGRPGQGPVVMDGK